MKARQISDARSWNAAPAVDAERRGRGVSLRDRVAPYTFLLPWLVGFFALTLRPALSSLYLSFTDYDLVDTPYWIGIGNYARIAQGDPRFWKAMQVTFTFVLLSVPLKLAFAL